jgi:molybdate transport system permease protein
MSGYAERNLQFAIYNQQPRIGWGDFALRLAVAAAVAIFLAFITLPLLALLLRVPLDGFFTYLTDPVTLDALKLSGITTAISLSAIILFGTPLAWLLGRRNFRGKQLIETIVELPLVVPPAVGGVALLLTFGRFGLLGGAEQRLGLNLATGTLIAVVLAQVFVAAPFYIKSARVGFAAVPREVEEAARVDGAGAWRTFRSVTAPLAAHGIAGGVVLCWARALGEFGATLIFAGNLEGKTQTMPLAIALQMQSPGGLGVSIILSAILIVASFTLLLVFKLLTGKSLEIMS